MMFSEVQVEMLSEWKWKLSATFTHSILL